MDYSAIIEHTKHILSDNGFDDRITAICSKVEELDLPVEKVINKMNESLSLYFGRCKNSHTI